MSADGRFFFHEHARKIGIWVSAFIISPYLGTFLSAIISNYEPWRTTFWICVVIVGLALVFVTFLGDETLYQRNNIDKQPRKPTGYLNYRIQMLTGIYGAKCKGRTTLWKSICDLFYILTRPYFLCLCGTFPHPRPLLDCFRDVLAYF
jgi:MFS family permease